MINHFIKLWNMFITFSVLEAIYYFSACHNSMSNGLLHLLTALYLLIIVNSQTINITSSNTTSNDIIKPEVVLFTTVTSISNVKSSQVILEQMAVPGFARKHGFNYVALDGWTCRGDMGLVIKVWQSPTQYLNHTLAVNDSLTRDVIKKFYQAAGVKLMVNVFGIWEKPISNKLNAEECANKLLTFIKDYGFDGANIDFQDNQGMKSQGLGWLTQFSLTLQSSSKIYIFSHTVDATLFDSSTYTKGDYSTIQKVVGNSIKFYNIRYFDSKNSFAKYSVLFMQGKLSIISLAAKGIPINKMIIGKPSNCSVNGYIRPNILLQHFKTAHTDIGWWGGAMFTPYISNQAQDLTRQLTLRRDNIQVISSVFVDSINFWYPPQKSAGDIGVPGYAPNNAYNYFILGTWTCRFGAGDILLLWSEAITRLSSFGNSTGSIQSNLKAKYFAKEKKLLVKAFGDAESPVTANLDPKTCAKSLAAFVKINNLDGADINFKDNIAFNNGIAQNWLITFTNALRNLLPFHIIIHTIQDFQLDKAKYAGGGYKKVISNVGVILDFYQIQYFGEQHTNFASYQQLFINSGNQFNKISVLELIAQGFQIDKVVIYKPVRLYDAKGAGFIEPLALRQIFMKANLELGWKTGVCYSSYINDQNGQQLQLLLRGTNKSQTIKFGYVDNVNVWWPPTATLAQMGVPTLAAPNIYNYFAYSFWTCDQGPLAMSKVYNDPLAYLGPDFGKTKNDSQAYIKNLYKTSNVKLMVSVFGASQNPVNKSLDSIACANKLIDYMNSNLLDGLDVDFEDSESFIDGVGQDWINGFMRQIRRKLPFHIVSHAPQGPYFSPSFAPKGAYLTINNLVGKFIDFYNVQFYNQGNTTYETYEQLFVDSGSLIPNTSVFQIISQGIQAEKLVLGKPVTKEDAYNSGYVNSLTLKSFLNQSVNDSKNPGWKPQLMFWKYLSDLNGTVIGTSMSYM